MSGTALPPEPAPSPAPSAVPLATLDGGADFSTPASSPLPLGEGPGEGEPPAPALTEPAPEPALAPTPEIRGLDQPGLDTLFTTARTRYVFRDTPVEEGTLRQLYELLRLGPTSGNCSPARFMFLRSSYAKDRLRPYLSVGNLKALEAPVIAIVAHDPKFYEDLPRLAPGVDARAWYAADEALAQETAFRNGTLQGAYLLMAARAVGLDCGPMSGFDNDRVDTEFFVAQGWRSNFLVALGHGDGAMLPPRAPRLSFDEACRIL